MQTAWSGTNHSVVVPSGQGASTQHTNLPRAGFKLGSLGTQAVMLLTEQLDFSLNKIFVLFLFGLF